MKIQTLTLHSYKIVSKSNQMRSGVLIHVIGERGRSGWGDAAPLPTWSKETLEESLNQLHQKKNEILKIDWTARNWLNEIQKLKLLPAVSFGFESALLSVLIPLSNYTVPASALLIGTPQEILEQAKLRHSEGYISAKLKAGNLSFEQAAQTIFQLKDQFRLRIDVNRAWNTSDSLRFFSQFPLDAFDYIEEPFQNPHDLAQFLHPLAIDESFPRDLSIKQLELLPSLKALIYKPTIQGGMIGCLPLYEWAKKRGVSLVLSSCFESDLGLMCIASIAHRLSLMYPIGIGTYDHFKDRLCSTPLRFSHSIAYIPGQVVPKLGQLAKLNVIYDKWHNDSQR